MRRMRFLCLLLPLLWLGRGCGGVDRPIEFHIDQGFTDDEVEMITWAMHEWNRAIAETTDAPYAPTFVIAGRTDDVFDIGDLTDGRHVIYRVTVPTQEMIEMSRDQADGTSVGGHAVREDVHVMRYHYTDWSGHAWLRLLQVIVLHELGHTIGLAHFEHRFGIMNPEVSKDILQDPHVTEADMEQYCIAHGCDE